MDLGRLFHCLRRDSDIEAICRVVLFLCIHAYNISIFFLLSIDSAKKMLFVYNFAKKEKKQKKILVIKQYSAYYTYTSNC